MAVKVGPVYVSSLLPSEPQLGEGLGIAFGRMRVWKFEAKRPSVGLTERDSSQVVEVAYGTLRTFVLGPIFVRNQVAHVDLGSLELVEERLAVELMVEENQASAASDDVEDVNSITHGKICCVRLPQSLHRVTMHGCCFRQDDASGFE